MARVPVDPHVASLGQKTMTRTIQCPHCGVVLNVPDSAAGKKLKCPQCSTKFAAPALGPADSAIAGSSPASTLFPTRKGPISSGELDLPPRAGSSGSIELPTSRPAPKKPTRTSEFDLPSSTTPTAPKKRPPTGEFDLPSSTAPKKRPPTGEFDLPMTSSAPLRETFDLPLLGEDLPVKGPSRPPSSAAADVNALFAEEPKKRKLTGAEARSKPRRCPDCGGVVGIGMSLCNVCGLDLDTGQRAAPLDIIDDDMPVVHREPMPAIGLLFVGTFSILINVVLAIVSLIASRAQGAGMLCLLIVWIFGIYSSVQFLRRKSIRPLFLSLGLAVAIGAVYLIAMPIIKANMGDDTPPVFAQFEAADPDAPLIRNMAEELDMKRITWGIAMLLSYAALSVYLNSPPIRREFSRS